VTLEVSYPVYVRVLVTGSSTAEIFSIYDAGKLDQGDNMASMMHILEEFEVL
jgi:hypothetical protein